jgi:hypothetical protein
LCHELIYSQSLMIGCVNTDRLVILGRLRVDFPTSENSGIFSSFFLRFVENILWWRDQHLWHLWVRVLKHDFFFPQNKTTCKGWGVIGLYRKNSYCTTDFYNPCKICYYFTFKNLVFLHKLGFAELA